MGNSNYLCGALVSIIIRGEAGQAPVRPQYEVIRVSRATKSNSVAITYGQAEYYFEQRGRGGE
jgi:hypothetical protein